MEDDFIIIKMMLLPYKSAGTVRMKGKKCGYIHC